MNNFTVKRVPLAVSILLVCALLSTWLFVGYRLPAYAQSGIPGVPAALLKIEISISTPKALTLKFNPNGGSVTPASKTIYKGKSFGTLPTPKRTDYLFKGWYSAKSGGTKIEASDEVTYTRNRTCYAHWAKNGIYGPPLPSPSQAKVNINIAGAAQLELLNGVGPKTALAIISYRSANGKFASTEDLMKVKGIGKATYDKIKNLITV